MQIRKKERSNEERHQVVQSKRTQPQPQPGPNKTNPLIIILIILILTLIQRLHSILDILRGLSPKKVSIFPHQNQKNHNHPVRLTLASRFNAVVNALTAPARSPSPLQHLPSRKNTFASSGAMFFSVASSVSASSYCRSDMRTRAFLKRARAEFGDRESACVYWASASRGWRRRSRT